MTPHVLGDGIVTTLTIEWALNGAVESETRGLTRQEIRIRVVSMRITLKTF